MTRGTSVTIAQLNGGDGASYFKDDKKIDKLESGDRITLDNGNNKYTYLGSCN